VCHPTAVQCRRLRPVTSAHVGRPSRLVCYPPVARTAPAPHLKSTLPSISPRRCMPCIQQRCEPACEPPCAQCALLCGRLAAPVAAGRRPAKQGALQGIAPPLATARALLGPIPDESALRQGWGGAGQEVRLREHALEHLSQNFSLHFEWRLGAEFGLASSRQAHAAGAAVGGCSCLSAMPLRLIECSRAADETEKRKGSSI